MVKFEDLVPTKRDAAVYIGAIVSWKLFVERWIGDVRDRVMYGIEAYQDRRDERGEKREYEREERRREIEEKKEEVRMRYMLESQEKMFEKLTQHLYPAKEKLEKGETSG